MSPLLESVCVGQALAEPANRSVMPMLLSYGVTCAAPVMPVAAAGHTRLVQVVGADWASRRWVCVVLESTKVWVTTERAFESVIQRFGDADALAVDIPIGLPETGPWRRAELEVRACVNPAAMFPTYPRAAYERPTHKDAVELCKGRSWPGTSLQSHGLWRRGVDGAAHLPGKA